MRVLVASLAILALTLPARAAETPPFTWLGVTIGQPAATLRQTLGDPLVLTTYADPAPAHRTARYVIQGTNALLDVTEYWGRVRSFRVAVAEAPEGPLAMPPDPSGIVLGQTAEEVGAKHPGARRRVEGDWVWLYELVAGQPRLAVLYKFFLTGRLQSIDYFLAPPDPLATPAPDALAALTEPTGDSYETAVIDGAKDTTGGIVWEKLYLSVHPCAPNQRWQMKMQSLQNNGSRHYDVLHVVCPSTNAERDYYFDITAFYGKLQ